MARWDFHVTDADLERLCRSGIPGYDPWRDAGDCRFDPNLARRALGFFADHLVFIEGETAGQPFALEDWQAAIVANLFGWVRPDGTRRYRETLIGVARKNGKTPLAAGIALYVLLCDGEQGAQVYSAAAELAQATLVYRHAAGMVARSPALSARCRTYRAGKSIEVPATSSFFRSLSADDDTKHGLNVHVVIIDELHAHKTGDLTNVLTTGTASRRQPLVVYITTSDYERPSICNEKWNYARDVRDGRIADRSFLPVIYEAGRDDDWTKPETWRKANPNLGVSVKPDYLERECQQAIARPSYRNTFLRLHLNLRTGSQTAAFDMAKWDACSGLEAPTGDRAAYEALAKTLEGQPCFGGLDLATTTDLIAWALYFPTQGALLLWFWSPRETAIERGRRDRVPYVAWAEDGWLRLTDGETADYSKIEADIVATCDRFQPRVSNFDPWNANQMVTNLRGHGVEMAAMRQGFQSLSPPTKELERLVVGRALRHGGHPVLRWMAGHAQLEMDAAGNVKFSKAKSRERIDGLAAAVMAIGASQVAPVPAGPPTVAFVSFDEEDESDGPA